MGDALDPGIKRTVAALFSGRLALGESWGIDLKTDSDQRTSGWVIPGCLYPSEYGEFVQPDRLAELKRLLRMPNRYFRQNGLHHEQADFTSQDDMDKFSALVGDWKADVVTSQTTWYQHSASKQQRDRLRKSLEMHRQLLVPGQGVEIRQEHAVPKRDNPNDFTLTSVYGRQSHYNLLVRDLAEPEKGYQRYAEFSNGRLDACTIGRPLIERAVKIGLL